MMKLRVMVPNLVGKETVLINVPSSSTVLELKKLLAAEISGDLRTEDLKLIYLGRLLPDLSLLSHWLLPDLLDPISSTRVEGDIYACNVPDLLNLKSDSGQQHNLDEQMSTHTLHLAYPPLAASESTLNKSSFLREESSKDPLGEQQQAQLAELYNTYLALYWQSVSQSEGSDLHPRLPDLIAPPAAPAISVPPPPPPTTNSPPEAYLEVLWGLLTCVLHALLIIAILHFYGSLNLAKFALAFAFAIFIILLGQEALRLNDEMEEEEEEETNNEAAVPQEELDDAELQLQQEGAFSILVSNIFLFFSSVFPEGLHLRV